MRCDYCGGKITWFSRYILRDFDYVESGSVTVYYHSRCRALSQLHEEVHELRHEIRDDIMTVEDGFNKQLKKYRDEQREDVENAHRDVISVFELNQVLFSRLEQVDKDNKATVSLVLEEARKIMFWLEVNAVRKEDGQYYGVMDPVLIELVTKYTGMELSDILNEIKDKEIKRMVNNAKKEKKKKKVKRHK